MQLIRSEHSNALGHSATDPPFEILNFAQFAQAIICFFKSGYLDTKDITVKRNSILGSKFL